MCPRETWLVNVLRKGIEVADWGFTTSRVVKLGVRAAMARTVLSHSRAMVVVGKSVICEG